MGIVIDELGKMAKKAVAHKIGEVAQAGAEFYLDTNHSVNGLKRKSNAFYNLTIISKKISFKKGFLVKGENNKNKYKIIADAVTFTPSVRLYDLNKQELGRVEREKSGVSSGEKYAIYINDERIGSIVRGQSPIKAIFDIDCNGWHLEGNLLRYKFDVFDRDENTIMRINKAYMEEGTYVFELDDKENEIMGLLLFMAIELSLHKKS